MGRRSIFPRRGARGHEHSLATRLPQPCRRYARSSEEGARIYLRPLGRFRRSRKKGNNVRHGRQKVEHNRYFRRGGRPSTRAGSCTRAQSRTPSSTVSAERDVRPSSCSEPRELGREGAGRRMRRLLAERLGGENHERPAGWLYGLVTGGRLLALCGRRHRRDYCRQQSPADAVGVGQHASVAGRRARSRLDAGRAWVLQRVRPAHAATKPWGPAKVPGPTPAGIVAGAHDDARCRCGDGAIGCVVAHGRPPASGPPPALAVAMLWNRGQRSGRS